MLYRLSDLKRYNNMPRIKSESLAEHQYYCAIILMQLKPYVTEVSYSTFTVLLQYMLIHDIGELYTGDIPHNVKEDYPDLKYELEKIENEKLTSLGFGDIVEFIEGHEYLKVLFKLCDTIQVVQYCHNEIRLGNNSNTIKEINKNALKIIDKKVKWLRNNNMLTDEFDTKEFLDNLC